MKAQGTSDKALGGLMLLAASTVFIYYTIWALLLVRGGLCHGIGISHISQTILALLRHVQPDPLLLPTSRMGRQITRIPPRRWTHGNRSLCRPNNHEGKREAGLESSNACSMILYPIQLVVPYLIPWHRTQETTVATTANHPPFPHRVLPQGSSSSPQR